MSMYKFTHFVTLAALLTAAKFAAMAAISAVVLAGCGLFQDSKGGPEYRSQTSVKPATLEVPPDLTSPTTDDRFMIPDAKAVTYSAYNRERTGTTVQQGSSTVLPKVDSARIERAGVQRWLVVKTTPDKAWATAKAFWTEAGFVLNRETPDVGIMETDWAENRSKLPQDFVRRTVGRVVDGLYSTGERDKFRTRLEAGVEPGTMDIFVSHRGAEEVYNNPDKLSLQWQPRASDKELEAEMLARLMLKFAFANATESEKTAIIAGATAAGATVAARATFDKEKGGALKVNEPFDRSWRRVSLALDNIGFTVEDRDRSKGLFFVRYIDPDAEANSGPAEKSFLDKLAFWRKDDPASKPKPTEPKPTEPKLPEPKAPAPKSVLPEKSFLDKLAFWRKDDPASKPQYRLFVSEAAGISDVVVQDADGKTDNSSTARRILSLLLEQLK